MVYNKNTLEKTKDAFLKQQIHLREELRKYDESSSEYQRLLKLFISMSDKVNKVMTQIQKSKPIVYEEATFGEAVNECMSICSEEAVQAFVDRGYLNHLEGAYNA